MTGDRPVMLGLMVPGKWSGESCPDVISLKLVTVVGVEVNRSLYEMKEIRRVSLGWR